MWQRLQTLYLAIAMGLIVAMLFSNCAYVLDAEGVEEGIKFVEKTPYLIFLIMLATAGVFSLSTFKWRILQMRVAMLQAILLVAFQTWIVVDFISLKGALIFSIPSVFPAVASILTLLGVKNIMLDEAMVQSAYRIRSANRKRSKK